MKQFFSGIFILILFGSCAKRQTQSNEEKIDDIIEMLSINDKPGIEVFIKKEANVIYHKAFGKSDLDANTDLMINSVYDIASVSKEFTAISILQLMESGKISLGDDIRKYLPEFPTEGNIITIENLLTHTSGIKRHTNLAWAENEANKSFENTYDVISYFQQDSLDFEPNERHSYVNMNYMILGYVIEEVSGLPYQEYLHKNIFEPLKMTNTFYPTDGQIISNKPIGYETKNGEFVERRPSSYSQSKGPGAIHTTATDLAKWYDGLVGFKIISKESLYDAWSPHTLSNNTLSNYGYGFYSDEKFGKLSIFHNGFIFGYSTSDLYFPEDDLLILVFSNISDINTINTNTIAFDVASVIYENLEVKLDAELLDSYVGNYNMDKGFKVTVSRKDLTLFISLDGGPADELSANTKTKFRVKDFPAKAEFIPSNDGGKMKIFLSNGSEQYYGTKE